MTNVWKYMPILKWKKGEQYALRKLTETQWPGVLPLLELDSMKAAPDATSIRAASKGYIGKVVEQIISSVPENQKISIDTRFVCTAYPSQANLLFYIFNLLNREIPHSIIPSLPANWVPLLVTLPNSHKKILSELSEIILRIRIDTLQPTQVGATIDALAKFVKRKRIHVVLDQFSLVDRKPADCVTNITPYIKAVLGTSISSITIAGGSFPENLTGKQRGTTDIVRVEWKVWEKLKGDFNGQIAYADYCVTNPIPLAEGLDGSKVNPSISIRYAGPDYWRLFKGLQFKKVANRGELRSLCLLLTTDTVYSGAPFSYADAQYLAYSIGPDTNGSPWTWRRDATNRHIVLTAGAL